MKKFFRNLKFVWDYCNKNIFLVILNVFLNILNLILVIVLPLVSAKIIILITDNKIYQFIILAILLFIINILYEVIRYFTRIIPLKVYKDVYSSLSVLLSKEVLKLENSVLDSEGTGPFITRARYDLNTLVEIFSTINNNISSIFKSLGKVVAMFFISPVFAIFTLFTILVLMFIQSVRIKRVNELDKEYRNSSEEKEGFASSIVMGARDIKMLNSEKSFLNRFGVLVSSTNKKMFNREKVDRNYSSLSMFFMNIFDFSFLLLYAILLYYKLITITMALVLYNYTEGIFSVVYVFKEVSDDIRNFNLSCERVRELIDGKRFRKEEFGKVHLNRIEGNFEFKNVSFKYDKKKVLDKLSFKVKANQIVAFVGKSGAGKTTIFNLLCKMYNVNSGKILIDGVDINDLDKDTIRGNITVISQNPYIFNLSIRDNLKLVKEDMSEEEMVRACKGACLHDFIMKLPKKYDTVVGEGGVMLSGGEKQRLAIARALLQRTEIILFDEATSALDNETQSKVQEAIENMKGEYTILIIAHRLSTIMNADKIYFINQGKVEAEGTHKGLLRKCKNYRHLYESELSKGSEVK